MLYYNTNAMSGLTNPLYLDAAASTPVDARVLEAMQEVSHGNAAARHHSHGRQAHRLVEQARGAIARHLNTAADNIVFTSGATESNNLALQGLARSLRATGKTHIITSAVEHSSVLACLAAMAQDGFTVTRLPVKPCGMVEASSVKAALTPQTGLVSIQAVNNEVGVIQPLAEIAAILKGTDILLHADAAQGLGRIALDMQALPVDLLSVSAHKIYGPQGIGALYVASHVFPHLTPLFYGGGHERGLRSGTLPVALCHGFGVACGLIDLSERAKMQAMRDQLIALLAPSRPVVHGHSDAAWNVPHIVSLQFTGIDQETLVMLLPDLSFGIGSACSSQGGAQFSHVLQAMTGKMQVGAETIRITLGRHMAASDIEHIASSINYAVSEIRAMQEAA